MRSIMNTDCNGGCMMPPDNTRHTETTETGVMPRIENEPALYREPPAPPLPEIVDDSTSQKTGEMPAILITSDESETHDEDTPKGSQ